MKDNNEPLEQLKSKCLTFTGFALLQDSLTLFLGVGILSVKPSLSVLKIQTSLATTNPNILVQKQSEQVLKIPAIFTGEEHTKDGHLREEELVNTLDISLALEVFIHLAFNLFSQRFEQIEFVN